MSYVFNRNKRYFIGMKAPGEDGEVLAELPTAVANIRSMEVFICGVSGVADDKVICVKNADGTYSWKSLTL